MKILNILQGQYNFHSTPDQDGLSGRDRRFGSRHAVMVRYILHPSPSTPAHLHMCDTDRLTNSPNHLRQTKLCHS